MTLTSKDLIEGPSQLTDECVAGYRDGMNAANPYPGGNRSPAYIHGFHNARRDMGQLPQLPMHEIVGAWNMIVVTEFDLCPDA